MAQTINIPALKQDLIEKLQPSGWVGKLKTFIYSSDFDKILEALWKENAEGRPFTPLLKNVFRCFKECPLSELKVIIVDSDPYPIMDKGKPLADGLAFSCAKDGYHHASNKVLLDAVHTSVYPNQPYDHNPELQRWANQGVLLLNLALTCEVGKPGGHVFIWKDFTAYLIDMLNLTESGLVWILMGPRAQNIESRINAKSHYVFTTEHPSYAVKQNRAFKDEGVFVKTNEILKQNYNTQIIW